MIHGSDVRRVVTTSSESTVSRGFIPSPLATHTASKSRSLLLLLYSVIVAVAASLEHLVSSISSDNAVTFHLARHCGPTFYARVALALSNFKLETSVSEHLTLV